MERRNSKEWIKSLKIALINNDIKKLELYSARDIPEFSSIEEAHEALSLINQAINILTINKAEVSKKMYALKQSRKFNISNNTVSSTFEFKA